MQGNFFRRFGILAALGVVGVMVSAAVSQAGSNLRCVQVKSAAPAPVVTTAVAQTTSSSCCTWDLCCLKAKVVCILKANTCFLEKVKASRCPDRCLCEAICNLTTALCALKDLSPCACQAEIEQAVCCVRAASCNLVKVATCTGNCEWIKLAKAIDCSVKELDCCKSCSPPVVAAPG
ncbi:MAG: hypothetical protein K8T25_18215 [Planctomycetia bacterium]|nr:hypothetical protein [Planctomycetia bacterium]